MNSFPSKARDLDSSNIPHSIPIYFAVSLLSPVIILTLIPAVYIYLMHLGTSGLNTSLIPTKHIKVKFEVSIS